MFAILFEITHAENLSNTSETDFAIAIALVFAIPLPIELDRLSKFPFLCRYSKVIHEVDFREGHSFNDLVVIAYLSRSSIVFILVIGNFVSKYSPYKETE